VRERRVRDPLVPLDFFRLRTPRTADLASLTVLAAPFGFSYVVTLFMQGVQGQSALETGLALLPGAALSAIVSRFAAPPLLARLGLRATAVAGMLVVSAGFLLLLAIDPSANYVSVVLPASIVSLGCGVGIAYPVFTIAAVADVEDQRQGLAAGIQSTALQVGGGIGLAIVSVVVASGWTEGASAAAQTSALRGGIVAGAALSLLGALIALVGFRRGPQAERAGSMVATDCSRA
jgi:Na+/melibiose symporter-like transporter